MDYYFLIPLFIIACLFHTTNKLKFIIKILLKRVSFYQDNENYSKMKIKVKISKITKQTYLDTKITAYKHR